MTIYWFILWACVWARVPRLRVEVRIHLLGVGSNLPLRGSWGSKTGCQAWRQVLYLMGHLPATLRAIPIIKDNEWARETLLFWILIPSLLTLGAGNYCAESRRKLPRNSQWWNLFHPTVLSTRSLCGTDSSFHSPPPNFPSLPSSPLPSPSSSSPFFFLFFFHHENLLFVFEMATHRLTLL